MVGAPTATWKDVLAKPPSASVTVRAMVANPCWPGWGVMVTVRLEPLPPKRISEFMTSDGLDEEPERTRFSGGVSMSPTVKGMGGVGAATAVFWLATLVMVGQWLVVTTS